MKKIKFFMLLVVVMLFTACHDKLWDSIEDLDSRVTKLEELCKEMNTNISALQAIVSVIQENDFITGIVPIEKGGEVIGYTIMFGKHEPITIYNGVDGKDGQNGSATAPIIGVAKDADGIYYWTLNGEWLLDDEGNKLPVLEKNGSDGENGTAGKDGVTPQLKIEKDYWYVSYDNGVTWTELGKAVGEDGEKGDKGDKGDSMFTSVTYDENNVYFTLTDGSVLIVPRGKNGGAGENDPSDIIKFEDLNVKSALLQMDIDTNGDGEISYGEAANYKGDLKMEGYGIRSFKEFQYFTGISRIGGGESSTSSNNVHVSFSYCSNLFEIVLPNTIDTIGYHAFYCCSKLKKVVLPDNVICIGEGAFVHSTSLSDVNIPDRVEYIGENAFGGCPLKQFTYPLNLKVCKIPFTSEKTSDFLTTIIWNCKNKIDLNYSYYYAGAYRDCRGIAYVCDYSGSNIFLLSNISNIILGEFITSIPSYFCQYTKLESMVIPDRITEIGKYAFYNCLQLKFIELSKNITTIDEYTFAYCSALTSINIPDKVTMIKNDAFNSCSALNTITLGENISALESYAFYGCSSLYMVYSKNPVPPTLGSDVFSGTTIGIIYVPTASVNVYKAAWSDYADKIVGYDF